ncbi:MAG: glycosyltransferase, partial [Halothece sp. Uz-M2-17]|nr:glycosyltransferase [Halothece sp. Uz-M2-17]
EFDPFTRITARRSIISFATTPDTAHRLHSLGASPVKRLSESGISEAELNWLSECPLPTTGRVRFINIARLLHWKGIHLGLQAFAEANLPDAEYWVVGEGPELKRLQDLAAHLNITHQVTFWGMLPRDEVLAKLSQCFALVHPSLHDSGGWVPLEAMATGRPIICLDLGGPSQLVTPDVGIKVPAHHPQQAVADLAVAMNQLVRDRAWGLQLGETGKQKVKTDYTWDAKGKQLADLYQDLVSIPKNKVFS